MYKIALQYNAREVCCIWRIHNVHVLVCKYNGFVHRMDRSKANSNGPFDMALATSKLNAFCREIWIIYGNFMIYQLIFKKNLLDTHGIQRGIMLILPINRTNGQETLILFPAFNFLNDFINTLWQIFIERQKCLNKYRFDAYVKAKVENIGFSRTADERPIGTPNKNFYPPSARSQLSPWHIYNTMFTSTKAL